MSKHIAITIVPEREPQAVKRVCIVRSDDIEWVKPVYYSDSVGAALKLSGQDAHIEVAETFSYFLHELECREAFRSNQFRKGRG